MMPAKKKQQWCETPPEAVEDVEKLRVERNRLRDQVCNLQARVAELEAALTAVNEVGRMSKGAAVEVDDEEVKGVDAVPRGNDECELPPEIWARILEFSLYSDVARMASVSTSFLHEVMPLLRSLYFDDAEAFTRKQAKRFESGNVEEIVIDCLLEVSESELYASRIDSSGDNPLFDQILHFRRYGSSLPVVSNRRVEFSISPRSWRLSLMLSCLSNVKCAFIGLGVRETKAEILRRLALDGSALTGYCHRILPEDSEEVHLYPAQFQIAMYADLLHSLAYAYRHEFIPQDLIIYGLPSSHSSNRKLCDDICHNFPLIQVTSLKGSGPKYIPFQSEDIPFQSEEVACDARLNLIAQREGGKDVIKSKQIELFRDLLERCFFTRLLEDKRESVVVYHRHVLNAMRMLKGYGCDPEVVNSEALSQAFLRRPNPYLFNEPPRCRRIKESTFRTLVEIGFSMSGCELSIIPDEQCSDNRLLDWEDWEEQDL